MPTGRASYCAPALGQGCWGDEAAPPRGPRARAEGAARPSPGAGRGPRGPPRDEQPALRPRAAWAHSERRPRRRSSRPGPRRTPLRRAAVPQARGLLPPQPGSAAAGEPTFTKLSASGKPGSTMSLSGLVAPVADGDLGSRGLGGAIFLARKALLARVPLTRS